MAGESFFVDQVIDVMLDLVARHGDFLEDHFFLGFEFFRREYGAHHVGQKVELRGQIAASHPAVIKRTLLGREGVVGAAQLIEADGDFLPAPPACAFEAHVFQKV